MSLKKMKRKFFILLALIITIETGAQQTTLSYFIDKAMTNSPLLKDYGNQVLSNKIDSMRIRSGLGPQLNAVSNNYYAPVINGWGFDEIVTDNANISALLSVSKDIVSRKNRENQFLAVQNNTNSLLNERKITEQDLIKNVTEQYINTYGSWQQYDFNSDMLELLIKEEQILKRLTENDVYRQTDYLTFLVTLQEHEYQVAQTRSMYRINLISLYVLCGIEDTASVSLSDPGISVVMPPDIQNSVFYQMFINDSIRLAIEDKQVDFDYKPRISIFSDAGYFSSMYYQPWKNFGASAGINLSIPVYDGNQRKMQHDKITLAEQTRENYRIFYVKGYHLKISQLFDQLKVNRQLEELLNKRVDYTRTLIDANHKLLQTGDLQVADYIIAINNYLSVKNEIVQNTIERYQLINQINYWNRTK
jgi:outer membrane protein TolC